MDSVLSAVGASRAGVFTQPGDFRPALVDWSPTSMELNIPDPGTKGGKATYRALREPTPVCCHCDATSVNVREGRAWKEAERAQVNRRGRGVGASVSGDLPLD